MNAGYGIRPALRSLSSLPFWSVILLLLGTIPGNRSMIFGLEVISLKSRSHVEGDWESWSGRHED